MNLLRRSLMGRWLAPAALRASALLIAMGCTDGGQSFDDGKDGVDMTQTTRDNESPTPTSNTGPSDETSEEPGDETSESSETTETSDEDPTQATDTPTDQTATDETPTDETAEESQGEEFTSDTESSDGSDAADDMVSDEGNTSDAAPTTEDTDVSDETDVPEEPVRSALQNATACLHFNSEGALEVEVRSECSCPSMIRCGVEVEGQDVWVSSYNDTSGPICPPACFVDSEQCPVEFEGDSGVLHHGSQQIEFTREMLADIEADPGSNYGVCVSNSTTPAPAAISVEDLCKRVSLLEQGELGVESEVQVDLTGAVELVTSQTAIGCDDDCCNWLWGHYIVSCGGAQDGGVVLTAEGAPFGSAMPEPGIDDDFEPQEVTMGCLGVECEPTCVPADGDAIGVVSGTLELLPEGYTNWMGEDAFGRAVLQIKAAL